MGTVSKRCLIYLALILVCALTASFAGPMAAVFSFAQVVAVIELLYWIAKPVQEQRG